MVIGIAGKKQSGKSTAGRIICSVATGVAVATAYADPLKVEVFDYLWSDPQPSIKEVEHIMITGLSRPSYPLYDDLEKITWVNERKVELRPLLQAWGTEYRRGQRQDYWVQKMRDGIRDLNMRGGEIVVITDVRFPNEAALVQELGGRLIRINRNVDSLVDPHQSEQHLTVPGIIEVDNNGSIEDLAFAMRSILCEFGVEVRWNNQHASNLVEEFNKEAECDEEHHGMMNGPRIAQSLSEDYFKALLAKGKAQ